MEWRKKNDLFTLLISDGRLKFSVTVQINHSIAEFPPVTYSSTIICTKADRVGGTPSEFTGPRTRYPQKLKNRPFRVMIHHVDLSCFVYSV